MEQAGDDLSTYMAWHAGISRQMVETGLLICLMYEKSFRS
jgi:hypothetical protein